VYRGGYPGGGVGSARQPVYREGVSLFLGPNFG
jgi:hypothetical protein